MPPDSTAFLKALFDSQQWTIIAVFSVLAAIATAIFDS